MEALDVLLTAARLPVGGPMPPFEERLAAAAAQVLSERVGMAVYPKSIAVLPTAACFLAHEGIEKRLCALAAASSSSGFFESLEGETGTVNSGKERVGLKTCPLTHVNAGLVRAHLPFTAPRPVGTRKSLGLGDRLGLATPGHLRAVAGTGLAPYLAQQSIREMTRTERTPDDVMDGATWGVLQEGWREGFGSDADHLKTLQDIDVTAAAGFTMFTVDPGEFVDSAADTDDEATVARKFEELPWESLETAPDDCRRMYALRPLPPACAAGPMGEAQLLHAAVKYGRAVAHTAQMYRHLVERMGDRPFELEMSVDETATPTTEYEHYYIASELRRLGVRWVSLAPRFVGDFEKGVDYIGDLGAFRESFARHAAIAQHLGPYKISLHSGSDKFSVYPIVAELTRGMVHVKTAGTSYLEAVRAIGTIDPPLFREILGFAHERYDEDKATYHVSADPAKVPQPAALADEDLPGVLDLFDGRQLLHVTYGSVLTARRDDGAPRFRDRLLLALRQDEEKHYDVLVRHIGRHAAPFADA